MSSAKVKASENTETFHAEGRPLMMVSQMPIRNAPITTYIEVKEGVSETDWIAFPYGKAVKEGAPVKELEGSGFADQLY